MDGKKIGNNFILKCFGKQHVLGGRESICLYIVVNIGLFALVVGWILSNNYYYHYSVYIIGIALYSLTEYNAVKCFITEPGIIPRYHPLYQSKDNTNAQPKEKVSPINSLLNEQGPLDSLSTTIIPSIFTERHCSTCKITRPPKASHCDFCDNCVLNFDHHCYFISNCVGARNHKYFFLVLFFGTILALYIAIFSIGHIIYVFIAFNEPNILSLLFKEHLTLMIVSSALISISLFMIMMGYQDYLCVITPAGIGYAIVIVLFFISTSKQTKVYPPAYNPFSVIVLVGGVAFCLFGGANLGKVLFNIFKGYTTKQLVSIQREYVKSTESKTELDKEYLRPKTCREKISNLYSVVFQKQIPSLIDPISDLESSAIQI